MWKMLYSSDKLCIINPLLLFKSVILRKENNKYY